MWHPKLKPSLRWLNDSALRPATCFAALLVFPSAMGYAETVSEQLQTLRNVQAGDERGLKQAADISKQLRGAKELQLIDVLKSMKGASPIGKNWLVGLANAIYRQSPEGKSADLKAFLEDLSQDGEARYTAFRWLTENDEELKSNLLSGMLLDPSLELRYDAVARVLADAESLSESQLRILLDAARHPEQVVAIIGRLDKTGGKVDQAAHFGFLTQWKFIGPFDNVGSMNFDKVYPIETDWTKNQLAETYEGKAGKVEWMTHATDSPEGAVDFAKLYNNEKGCIVYGVATVKVPEDVACEIRVGCINAQKVWVNGDLVVANEVYHTGMQIDQYSAPIRLKAGVNRVLIKVCQNEQKEAWAQQFLFQARLCDETGKAISLAP